MNGMRKFKRLITAPLILLMVLIGMTFSIGHAQGPGDPFLVKDIWPGPDSSDEANWDLDCNPATANGTFLFLANDGTHGDEVWRSDGTEAGTLLVEDIVPGSGSPFHDYADCAAVNNLLFFYADNGSHGREVWRSDGTEAGTFLVKDINQGLASSNPSWPSVENDLLFFSATDGVHGEQTWQSDGTEGGTVMFKDTLPGPGFVSAGPPTDVSGILFFWADDGVHGSELWKSDGTEAGTVLVKDINPGTDGSYAEEWIAVNSTFFFYYNDGTYGSELWKSDGTEGGTFMVRDINPGPDSSYASNRRWPTEVNGMIFFWANDGSHGSELWRSDGTETGTTLVMDVRPGLDSSDRGYRYDPLTVVNSTLFFTPDDGSHGIELWKSDGTEAGTVMVKDIYPGSNSSSPRATWRGLTAVDGTLFFRADDGVHGSELWKSDGSEGGTLLVNDIRPGSEGSGPYFVTEAGGALFFTADDGTHGRELWGLPTLAPQIIRVDIDIKPGSDPNSINCNNRKAVIAVVILTTEDFDATAVDHITVTFEGASETHVDKNSGDPHRHEEDVDRDGDMDLVFHFRLADTDLACDSTEGTLRGETFDGQAIEGSDAVRMISRGSR